MKKTRVLLVVLLALFVGFLTACTSTEDLLNAAKDELVANYADTIASETYQVTGNLNLVTEIGDATVSWTSSNTAIITTAGVVTRPETDTVVTLTATLTIDGETLTHQFRVTVKAVELTVAQRLAAAKALLVTNYANTIGNAEYVVTANLALVSVIGDATVTWTTSDAAIITTAGVVTRPSFAVGDQTVTLTATLTISGQTTTQIFYAFVEALDETVAERLDRALAFVTTFPAVEGITGAEDWIEFPTSIVFEEQTYTVSWVSDKPDYLAVDGTVTRPASGAANQTVVMTATITEGTVTRSMEKEFVVFAYESSTLLASIADIYTQEAGTYVKFEGVTVIGKMSGGFFISDGTTMLYIYDTSTLYNTVVVGQVYDIEGVYGLYYSAPQLANDATRPLTAVASTATPASMNGTPSTVAEAIGDKAQPSGANLMVYNYLSITGKVMVDNQETVDVGRYNTFLVDTTFTGTQVIKTLASGKATAYNTPAIVIYYQSLNKAAVEALNGKEVTINILLYGWRTDRNIWYAVYLGDGTDIQVAFATDADAVAAVKTALTLPATIVAATTLDLLEAQYGATVSWASSNEAVINPTTGVVTPVAGQQVTVTLTATITKNAATDTKVFTIKVGELPMSTVLQVIDAANATEIKTKGVVTAAEYYRTFFIQDSTGGIAIYTADATMLATLTANIGKEVVVIGTRAVYNGLRQISPTSITTSDAVVTLPDAVNVDEIALNSTDMMPYQGRLVSMTQLYVSARAVDTFNNVTLTLSRLVEGKTIVMKWDSRKALSTEAAATLAALQVGDTINITNVLAWNNNPYFYFTNTTIITEVTLNDAGKVALDSAALSVVAAMTEAGTLTLPTTGTNGSTIAWTSNNALIDASTGAVTMPGSGQVTVTLTATLTLNAAEKVVTFDVLLGTSSAPVTYATDLFISYYMEGSTGNRKVIVVHNFTGVDVDLSNYRVGSANNPTAAPTASSTFGVALTGTLGHGKSIVVHHGDMTTSTASGYLQEFVDLLAAKPEGTLVQVATLTFNGTQGDIIALVKNVSGNWTFIDYVGEFTSALASGVSAQWEIDYTKDHVLIRKPTVLGPATTTIWTDWIVETAHFLDTRLFSWK